MKLIVVHQILIGAAIGLAAIFGLRSLVLFAKEGAAIDLVLVLASLAIGVALSFYFRKVRARWRSGRDVVSLPR